MTRRTSLAVGLFVLVTYLGPRSTDAEGMDALWPILLQLAAVAISSWLVARAVFPDRDPELRGGKRVSNDPRRPPRGPGSGAGQQAGSTR